MKKTSTSNPARVITSQRKSLQSLLVLASGAASLGALESSVEAAIVYTPFATPQTVGFGSHQLGNLALSLPGGAGIAINTASSGSHQIVAAISSGTGRFARQANNRTGVSGRSVAFRTNAGKNWNAPGRNGALYTVNIIRSTTYGKLSGPGSFSHKYLLFQFTDASAGNQTEYGWVGMSGATVTPGDPTKMSVTFTGWAYDDSGALINAGATAVPEASTGVAGLLAAAMVVGSAGLRQWRKSRPVSAGQPGFSSR